MKAMLEKISFTYIMFLLKPIDINHTLSYEELLKQIKLVMELLILTDNGHYLLTILRDFFYNL